MGIFLLSFHNLCAHLDVQEMKSRRLYWMKKIQTKIFWVRVTLILAFDMGIKPLSCCCFFTLFSGDLKESAWFALNFSRFVVHINLFIIWILWTDDDWCPIVQPHWKRKPMTEASSRPFGHLMHGVRWLVSVSRVRPFDGQTPWLNLLTLTIQIRSPVKK